MIAKCDIWSKVGFCEFHWNEMKITPLEVLE